MKTGRIYLFLTLTFFCAMLPADEIAVAGRNLAEQWHRAVIQVKLVTEINEYENKTETSATFVDEAGVAVMSLSSIDPGYSRNDADADGSGSKVKDLKMVLADGSEIEGEVILRDPDLDLVLIRPVRRPSSALTWINLTDTTRPEIMEPILVLSRMNENIGRSVMVSAGRIQAVLKKPRRHYVTDLNSMLSGLAVPVFTTAGKLIGIMLLRTIKSETGMSAEPFGGLTAMGNFPVVVPAQEIQRALKKIPR